MIGYNWVIWLLVVDQFHEVFCSFLALISACRARMLVLIPSLLFFILSMSSFKVLF